MLSLEQIEDTVAAAALREEILRATQQIRELPIFKNPAVTEAQQIEQHLPAPTRASTKVVSKLSPEKIKKAITEDIQKVEETLAAGSQNLDQQLNSDLKKLQEQTKKKKKK